MNWVGDTLQYLTNPSMLDKNTPCSTQVAAKTDQTKPQQIVQKSAMIGKALKYETRLRNIQLTTNKYDHVTYNIKHPRNEMSYVMFPIEY